MLYNNILTDFVNTLRNVKIGQLCQSILDRKKVFKGHWNIYKQIYKFDELPTNIYENINFENIDGFQLVEYLKNLPFDTFIIKLCENNKRFFNVLFRKNLVNMKSYDEEKLLMVSRFVVNNYLCIFFSPVDLNGNMSKKSFVIKLDLKAPVDYSLSRYDSELVGLRYGKNYVSSDKLHYASCVRKSVEYLIYHLIYLSMCYKYELPKNINYIMPNRTYNTINNFDIISNTDNNIKNKVIIKKETTYYQENNNSIGASKSTHARRGHQHRFWVGSGEDKKLVTKWVKPTIINEGKEELRTLVTNVI